MSQSRPAGLEQNGQQLECHPTLESSALSQQELPQESPKHQGRELRAHTLPSKSRSYPWELLGTPHTQ